MHRDTDPGGSVSNLARLQTGSVQMNLPCPAIARHRHALTSTVQFHASFSLVFVRQARNRRERVRVFVMTSLTIASLLHIPLGIGVEFFQNGVRLVDESS